MKRIFTILAAILLTASVFAQSPEKMSYQAVIRNAENNLITSHTVGIQISILQGSTSGTSVYTETQTPTTNANGLISIEIGSGTVVSGNFDTIDWASGPYFIKTETDPTGGSNYTITGTSQLLSVPYALHSKTAESITGTITETDPIYSASQAVHITAGDITKLSNLSGTNTGDQDLSALATSASLSSGLASKVDTVTGKGLSTEDYTTAEKTKLAGLNNTYGPETDPTYSASQAAHITASDITKLSKLSGTNTGDQDLSTLATTASLSTGLALKVDKVTGKGLSTEDYTTAEKTKLAGLDNADGSETKLTAGTNVTITGSGTIASPYVINTMMSITQVQRDALTPTAGLIVYNTTINKPNYFNGNEWMNFDGTSAKALAIGDSYQGGIIAYIFQSGDPGYVAGEFHGLIAAPSDQGLLTWGCAGTMTGANAADLGTGKQNTINILAACSTAGTAADICNKLVLNGYDDWFLPSMIEITKLYENRTAIGGFDTYGYWSSTETTINWAWYKPFNGGEGEAAKDSYFNVRAIRYF